MENKNQELALKNLQLKEELRKLVHKQNDLLKQNIKFEYTNYKSVTMMVEILDDNINTVEEALLKMKRLKDLLLNERRSPLTEKVNKK